MANTINIELIAKDLASKTIQGVSTSAGGLKTRLEAATGASKAFALGLTAATTAAVGLVGFGSKIAGDLESARQGFVALLGSAEAADDTMARIKEEAKSTPFELPGLVKGTQALAAITKDGDKAVDMLLDVGKAIAISGKGQEDLDRVIFNLQQISSTGKVTAMDIRQFQGAIPIFNDIVEATGMTVDEMMSADNAAELLADAFKQAGKEGGITAQGFTAQAGTFNQLVSNMKDNFTIFMSDLVKSTGIFDSLKGAISRVNNFIEENGDAIKASIKNGLEWFKNNLPIIAGVIAGALVPAFYALAGGVWATLAPLLPFMAAGAAVAFILTRFSDEVAIVAGWLRDNLMPALTVAAEFLRGAFSQGLSLAKTLFDVLKPSIMALWNVLATQLFPALKLVASAVMQVWQTIAPTLIPVLKFLAGVVLVGLVAHVYIVINVIRVLITVFSAVISAGARLASSIAWVFRGISNTIGFSVNHVTGMLQGLLNWFKGLPNGIGNAVNGIQGKITAPFKQAFNEVATLWNNGIGAFRFEVPDWVPGMGGKNWSFPKMPYLAKGTSFHQGGLAMVGEQGREIVNLPRGSQVIPNRQTENIIGGGSGGGVSIGVVNLNSAGAVDRFIQEFGLRQTLAEQGLVT